MPRPCCAVPHEMKLTVNKTVKYSITAVSKYHMEGNVDGTNIAKFAISCQISNLASTILYLNSNRQYYYCFPFCNLEASIQYAC